MHNGSCSKAETTADDGTNKPTNSE